MKSLLALSLCLLFAAGALVAADIGGKWKGQFQGGDSTREIAFDFKVNGEALTGVVSGLRDKTLEIKDGKVQGDAVSFWVQSEWQGEPIKLVYKGKISGNEIQFTMGTEDGGWSTEITAKRVS
jgi:opacity protein-like surface antigen